MTTIRSLLRRGAVIPLATILTLAVTACGGSASTDGGGNGGAAGCPGTGTATVTDGDAAICADDLAFDAATIEAPAGEDFTITFTNAESVPHNVAVYTDEGGEEILVGEIITGPDATDELAIPAQEPGTYYFRCDVHPEMEGTLVVS